MPNPRYSFRHAAPADTPMLRGWLATPEAVRWWGDPAEQEALIVEDFDNPLMQQWIVACDGKPFAYVQAYPAHAWPQTHLAHLPPGSEAVDAFIGVPAMLGQGHGRRFLRAFATMLRAQGATAVAIDPAADNHRARRAYALAGFVGETLVDTAEGPAVVMLFDG